MRTVRTSDARALLALVLACFVMAAASFAKLSFGSERGTLAVLRAFPVHVTDVGEDQAKRDSRLSRMASAIDAATEDPVGRAALVTILRFESNASAYVYEDRCFDGPRGPRECDSGRARGPWQLHANRLHPEIPEAVEEQAMIALRLWRGARERCSMVVTDELVGAFSAYGTGGSCGGGRWAAERAAFMRKVVGRL